MENHSTTAMLLIKASKPLNSAYALELEYQILNSTPGREGTTLSETLRLFISEEKCRCILNIDDCIAENHKAALDKMVNWLRRLADSIEQRKEQSIPM